MPTLPRQSRGSLHHMRVTRRDRQNGRPAGWFAEPRRTVGGQFQGRAFDRGNWATSISYRQPRA
eukprot:3901022-Lingulodinium_polyedra.AAC.1